jgi:hypothetical protein
MFSMPQDSKHRTMSKEGEERGRSLTEGIPIIFQEVPRKTTKILSQDSRFRSEYNPGTSQIQAGIIVMNGIHTKTGSSKTSLSGT